MVSKVVDFEGPKGVETSCLDLTLLLELMSKLGLARQERWSFRSI